VTISTAAWVITTLIWRQAREVHKGTVAPKHIMKAYLRSGSLCSSRYFNMRTTWEWMASLMPWPLYPYRKSPHFPLNRLVGVPQSMYGCFGDGYFAPTGIQTLTHPTCNLVTIMTAPPIKCTCARTNDFVLVFSGVQMHLFLSYMVTLTVCSFLLKHQCVVPICPSFLCLLISEQIFSVFLPQ
jgi:hypothetical protein